MSKNDRTPWEDVSDPSYFRQVMGNIVALGFGPRRAESAHVRFGLTGVGHAPNYQIEAPDGTKHCFRGMGHGEATDAGEEFAANNLSSETFSYSDIEKMLARIMPDARR